MYPRLEADQRYTKLLGRSGSSPIELFWDVVDDLDAEAESDRQLLQPSIERLGLVIVDSTTEADFEEALRGDAVYDATDKKRSAAVYHLVRSPAPPSLSSAHRRQLHSAAMREAKEDRREAERKLRGQVDDLRYALRKVEPSIGSEATYEQVRTPSASVSSPPTTRRPWIRSVTCPSTPLCLTTARGGQPLTSTSAE